jgi:hypothetical protein
VRQRDANGQSFAEWLANLPGGLLFAIVVVLVLLSVPVLLIVVSLAVLALMHPLGWAACILLFGGALAGLYAVYRRAQKGAE